MKVLDGSCSQLRVHSSTPKHISFKFCTPKLSGFKVLLVDDPEPTQESDVKVVDILKISGYSLCKISGGWFLPSTLTNEYCSQGTRSNRKPLLNVRLQVSTYIPDYLHST